jgi:hypothetical protein
MKTTKTELLETMKKCLPGVEKGASIIEGADTFVLRDKALHSYNDSISVTVPSPLEGLNGAIKSIDFFKLISKLPAEEIEINQTEKTFNIKAGAVEADMNLVQSAIAGYIDTLKAGEQEYKELTPGFFDAVRLCKISCNRAPLRGIFVTGTRMLSTDIYRINRHELGQEMDVFWLDDPVVVELLKIPDLTHYAVSDSWVHFKNSAGVYFSCKRKDESSFPVQKIEELIENGKKEDGDLENELPDGIAAVADRTAVLSSDIDGIPMIEMVVKKDNVEFFAERSAGRIRESLKLEKPFKEEVEIKLWIDPSFLIDAAQKVRSFYIKEMEIKGKQRKSLVFYNDKYVQVTSTFVGNKS